jgi:hypothetical protein
MIYNNSGDIPKMLVTTNYSMIFMNNITQIFPKINKGKNASCEFKATVIEGSTPVLYTLGTIPLKEDETPGDYTVMYDAKEDSGIMEIVSPIDHFLQAMVGQLGKFICDDAPTYADTNTKDWGSGVFLTWDVWVSRAKKWDYEVFLELSEKEASDKSGDAPEDLEYDSEDPEQDQNTVDFSEITSEYCADSLEDQELDSPPDVGTIIGVSEVSEPKGKVVSSLTAAQANIEAYRVNRGCGTVESSTPTKKKDPWGLEVVAHKTESSMTPHKDVTAQELDYYYDGWWEAFG